MKMKPWNILIAMPNKKERKKDEMQTPASSFPT